MPQLIADAVRLSSAILEELKKSDEPMHAHSLFDKPSVRLATNDKGKVSVTLSDLHKASKVTRIPVTVPGTSVKYAYSFNADKEKKPKPVAVEKPKPVAVEKPQITVTAHNVIIELSTIKITVEV